jgi:hypothetical protein
MVAAFDRQPDEYFPHYHHAQVHQVLRQHNVLRLQERIESYAQHEGEEDFDLGWHLA